MAIFTLMRTRFDEPTALRLSKTQTGRIRRMGLALCTALLVAGPTMATERYTIRNGQKVKPPMNSVASHLAESVLPAPTPMAVPTLSPPLMHISGR